MEHPWIIINQIHPEGGFNEMDVVINQQIGR